MTISDHGHDQPLCSNNESRLSRLLAWGKAELYGTPRAAILLLIDRASRRDELKALLYAIGDVPRYCLLLVATIVSVIFIKVETNVYALKVNMLAQYG